MVRYYDDSMPTALDPQGLVRDIRAKAHDLVDWRTDIERLFVLAHFGVPVLDVDSWRLEVTGLVDAPRSFSYDELLAMPARKVEAFLQCAGFPSRPDIATRRIANVEWTGIDLRSLLDQCGVAAGARYIWSYGHDEGSFQGSPPCAYVKDMPFDRLLLGDVLLAYLLNGQPLSRAHGFPVRLVVPGYYGTNSVKWLRRIEIANQRRPGLFTTRLYNDPDGSSDRTGAIRKPVWEVGPEAIIVAPPNRFVAQQSPLHIKGWAWSSAGIERVEISTDGGEQWFNAELSPRRHWSWQAFGTVWTPKKAGLCKVLARAVDTSGAVQPMKQARNAVHRIYVQVT